jgi:uncharacterized protein YbgA (DUF1722 family)/uncharacterized protein YbbK (DUF523 family)
LLKKERLIFLREFVKPEVIISKCIGFEACRWNGLIIKSEFVEKLKNYVNFHPVCPEVEIGLGVPRDPIRVIEIEGHLRLYQPSTEEDLTGKMENFTNEFLENVKNVDGFILKNKSPSCGIKAVRVYHGYGQGRTKNKYGFFGGAVLKKFPYLAVEDEGRLRNLKLRENFLTKLYVLANFRKAKESRDLNELIKFHTMNKYLLMTYNQENVKKMGRIIANQNKIDSNELINKYEDIFRDSMLYSAGKTSNINVLMHSLGYFSKDLSSNEKSFFLDSVEKYRQGIYPLLVCQNILKSWIIRFDNRYLGSQTFFEPYPEELIEITTIYGQEQ